MLNGMKLNKFLYLSLVSTVLVLSVSPSAIATVIKNDCVSFYQNTLKSGFSLPILKNVKFFDVPSAYGTRLMVVDLAQVPRLSLADRIVASYFSYVRAIYRERLKKFEGDISPAAERDQEALDRSLAERSALVLDTPNDMDPHAPTFNGGVRVTFSRTPAEKLPFQYEFPEFQRYDTTGSSVEVGRLTAQPGVARDLTINLIKIATEVALQDPTVSDIYVHTSRAHSRLYRLMGLIPTNVDIKDDLNYVLRFTVQDAINWLKHQQTH